MNRVEPGNIGSVARVVKGMGLSQLYLVNPVPFRDVDAAWYMAHGAKDILENCHVVPELKDALEGIQYLVGTTHRRRDVRLPPACPCKGSRRDNRHNIARQTRRAAVWTAKILACLRIR